MPILRQERERERERERAFTKADREESSIVPSSVSQRHGYAFVLANDPANDRGSIRRKSHTLGYVILFQKIADICFRHFLLSLCLSLSLSLCPPNYLSFFLPCSTNQPLSFFKRITKRLFFEVVNAIRSFRFKRKCVVTTVEYLSALSHLHGYMG